MLGVGVIRLARHHDHHRSYLDVATESTRPHHKPSKHLRDPSSLSPTYNYESKRTQRKDYYTPRTDVLAPSRSRSFSPTSPTGISPSSRYSPSRPYTPSTYRPSSPMGTYRPSSPDVSFTVTGLPPHITDIQTVITIPQLRNIKTSK